VHWDEEFAREVGAPGAYDYGPERCSWLTHHLTNWMGDDGFLDGARHCARSAATTRKATSSIIDGEVTCASSRRTAGMLGMLGYLAQLAFFTGADPQPQGSQHPNLVPYGTFPARDGSIIIACLTNAFWERICEALGMPGLSRDSRFDTIEKRRDRRDSVNDIIAQFTRHKTVEQLVDLFTRYQVPHAPILGITEALAQPQAVARQMVVQTEHKTLGSIPIVNRSITFPGEQQPVPTAPPVLGEHTDEILRDVLGLDPQQIAALRAANAVA
jgi:crotonobetainyl-CoA:carnitine CoA-transferase CaiB-like acyl-CoA transferase